MARALYSKHRGKFTVGSWPLGKSGELSKAQKDTIDSVLDFYGDKSGHWLSELTHAEKPWQEAREGLATNQRGNRRIKHGVMADYYGQLLAAS